MLENWARNARLSNSSTLSNCHHMIVEDLFTAHGRPTWHYALKVSHPFTMKKLKIFKRNLSASPPAATLILAATTDGHEEISTQTLTESSAAGVSFKFSNSVICDLSQVLMTMALDPSWRLLLVQNPCQAIITRTPHYLVRSAQTKLFSRRYKFPMWVCTEDHRYTLQVWGCTRSKHFDHRFITFFQVDAAGATLIGIGGDQINYTLRDTACHPFHRHWTHLFSMQCPMLPWTLFHTLRGRPGTHLVSVWAQHGSHFANISGNG